MVAAGTVTSNLVARGSAVSGMNASALVPSQRQAPFGAGAILAGGDASSPARSSGRIGRFHTMVTSDGSIVLPFGPANTTANGRLDPAASTSPSRIWSVRCGGTFGARAPGRHAARATSANRRTTGPRRT